MVPHPSKIAMSSIKVTKNEVTRKIRVEDASSWEGIARRLAEVFSSDAESLVLTYADDDDDVITLSSVVEPQGAVRDGIKKFDLSSSTDQDPLALDTATETTTTTKRERDADPADENISYIVKRSVSSREPSYFTASAREAISDERGAPSTLTKRRKVQGFWFAFLEENGFQREWDPKGPSIGTCADVEYYLGLENL